MAEELVEGGANASGGASLDRNAPQDMDLAADERYSVGTSLKVLWHFTRPYKGLVAAIAVALVFDMAGMLYVPTELSAMINAAVSRDGGTGLMAHGARMLAAALCGSGGAVAAMFLAAKLSSSVGRDLRTAVYEASLAFSGSDFERFGTGSMITRTLSDANVVQQTLNMAIIFILPVPVMSVIAVALAFSIDTWMGWVLMGITASVLAVTIAAVRVSAPIFTRLQGFIDRMNVRLREAITGVRVIRAFGRDAQARDRLDRTFQEYADNAIRVNLMFATADSMTFFLMNGAESLIIWLGADRVGAHAMMIGSITALIEYAMLIMFFMMMAQFALLSVPRALACLERARQVLDWQPEICDDSFGDDSFGDGFQMSHFAGAGDPSTPGPSAPSLRMTGEGTGPAAAAPTLHRHPERSAAGPAPCRHLERSAGGAESKDLPTPAPNAAAPEVARFDHVSFRFHDADEDTLHDLDFALRRGQVTAIIGNTGSGKSTIAKMLLRFHDVTAGRLLFNGVDLRNMPQAELRARISYVPQKAWLFSGTIAENLRHGDPDAADNQLWHAIDTAQGAFVHDLPDGLQSRVAQGGTNFSGGQRQRLAIARALVRRAELYIFDDSFSALDYKTDAALRHALKPELGDAATLIIAQRVSTIRDADQILVLDEGRAVGLGTHSELMEGCPAYRAIADSQARKSGREERHA